MASVRHSHTRLDDADSSDSCSMASEPGLVNSSRASEPAEMCDFDGYESDCSGAWDACQNDGYDDLLNLAASSEPQERQDGCTIMDGQFYKNMCFMIVKM